MARLPPILGVHFFGSYPIAVLAAIRGEHAHAYEIAGRAWNSAEACHDVANLALAGYALTNASMALGHFVQALDHA